MKEIRAIVKALDKAKRENIKAALATVVHIEGSAYRKHGARMLITEKGELTGAISGGCLEEDVLRKAMHVMFKQENRLITYETTDEADVSFGLRLGCNGIIHILIEPIAENQEGTLPKILRLAAQQIETVTLAVVFSLENRRQTQVGTYLLSTIGNLIYRNDDFPLLSNLLKTNIEKTIDEKQSVFTQFFWKGKRMNTLIQYLEPVISVNIIGTGYDVFPLINICQLLGWEAKIIGERPSSATKNLQNSCRMIIAQPTQLLDKIVLHNRTAFILMSHNYQYDKNVLKNIIQKDIPYIGMLGPKSKFKRIIKEYEEEGITISEEQIVRVHSPIGLDIGAETAEEIALCIAAEIMSVFAQKAPIFLKNKIARIHA